MQNVGFCFHIRSRLLSCEAPWAVVLLVTRATRSEEMAGSFEKGFLGCGWHSGRGPRLELRVYIVYSGDALGKASIQGLGQHLDVRVSNRASWSYFGQAGPWLLNWQKCDHSSSFPQFKHLGRCCSPMTYGQVPSSRISSYCILQHARHACFACDLEDSNCWHGESCIECHCCMLSNLAYAQRRWDKNHFTLVFGLHVSP